jgi:hypothetical protein
MSNNSGRVESSRNAPSASCMAIPKIEACWDMYIVLFVSVSLSNLLRRYHHTHKSQSHFTEFNVTFFLETFFFFFFSFFFPIFPPFFSRALPMMMFFYFVVSYRMLLTLWVTWPPQLVKRVPTYQLSRGP